jgi:transcriptional regulator GlxA family with amidase domain
MNLRLNQIQNWPEMARRAKWSVIQLATLCGVSIRTLERHFQEMYQQTPEHWLAELRWRQALELVREGTSVKAMAAELGYQQASTFSREFKKRFGQCPATFSTIPAGKAEMAHKAM